jgi:hypothetical protein
LVTFLSETLAGLVGKVLKAIELQKDTNKNFFVIQTFFSPLAEKPGNPH